MVVIFTLRTCSPAYRSYVMKHFRILLLNGVATEIFAERCIPTVHVLVFTTKGRTVQTFPADQVKGVEELLVEAPFGESPDDGTPMLKAC